MAAPSISVAQDQFTCPICLDLLNEPVTIPCGHTYCMGCVKGCWDQDDQKGAYSCPQCRQSFVPRPVLGRNPILAEMVEKLKKTGLQVVPLAHCYAGPGDVECGVCTGRKRKADKSCLECLDSYCQSHFELHEELHSGKRHKVIDASGEIQKKCCPQHNKLLEVFCRTDQQCVCMSCVTNEHKGHDIISADAGKTEKQVQLGASFQRQIQERKKELQDLRQTVKPLEIKSSAQTAVEDSEKIFTELISSIERRRSEVTKLIRDKEQGELSRAEGLEQRLEQKIAELEKKDIELAELSHRDDDIHFLQSLKSLCESEDLPSITVSPLSFEDVKESVSKLKEQVEVSCQEQFEMIQRSVNNIFIEAMPTTQELFQYSCKLTLDPSSAFRHHELSEDCTEVEWSHVVVSDYGDNRFQSRQVLCNEGLSARCSWEVEWTGDSEFSVAVAYKEVSRSIRFGYNDQSWSLYCSSKKFSFLHNNIETKIPGPISTRIVVYLDHKAGILCFYSKSGTITLLHRVQTTFTEPLYPGFYVTYGNTLKIHKQQKKKYRY